MKATREQVLAMAREAANAAKIYIHEEGDAEFLERLVHLAQQFTLDQLRAQGQRVYMAGSYAKFLDGTSDHIPLGGEVSFVNLNWKNQIELIRIPETLE